MCAAVARIFFERRDSPTDPRRRAGWMDDEFTQGQRATGDTVPPMDVLDTESGVEIIMDLPGIEEAAVSVTYRDGTVIVSGTKRPTRCQHGRAAFHLAERGFGRFARAVKVAGAIDTSRATATLEAGELRIVLPRLEERRGHDIRIRVDSR
jgi:HSP20 family protein